MSDDPFPPQLCEVCGSDLAFFGYGPPLVRGRTIWACQAHRGDVERLIKGESAPGEEPRPGEISPPAP